MNEQAKRILGAADSAHQGIELAISLLQEALACMGEILTQGCASLGTASLGSAMRVGQTIKNMRFRLEDLKVDVHRLCALLGHDLGVCGDDAKTLSDMVGEPLGTPDHRDFSPAFDDSDSSTDFSASDNLNRAMADLYQRELEPGEDEFDDDEQPF